MENVLVLAMAGSILMWAVTVGVIAWASRESVKRTFMTKELQKYGGTICHQGAEFKVDRGAEFKIGLGSIIIMNPDGTVRRFTVGNVFTPQPVVTIKR